MHSKKKRKKNLIMSLPIDLGRFHTIFHTENTHRGFNTVPINVIPKQTLLRTNAYLY